MRDAAALARVADAYADYDREQAERYLHPGEPQTRQTDKPHTDSAADERQQAYAAYDAEAATAYLRGK